MRRRIHRHLRDNELPLLKQQYETNTKDLILLQKISRLIVLSCDVSSVSWVCQALVRERKNVLPYLLQGNQQKDSNKSWILIICKLALFCVQFIAEDKDKSVSIAPCLRFFEVYCANNNQNNGSGVDPNVLNKERYMFWQNNIR